MGLLMARPSIFLSRLVALTLAWLLATAAITYAAGRRIATGVTPKRVPVAPVQRKVLVVPDVRRQAYVFAKGILSDGGFAWQVRGSVPGLAANVVAAQSPAPGTRVAENGSQFPGTPIQLADLAVERVRVPRTAVPRKPAAPTKAAPQKQAPKKHAPKHAAQWPQHRPPAFVVPGGKHEPLDEMPLTVRATRLLDWVGTKPAPTDANVSYWLYQHQWVVTGARLGWWRGAEALRTLLEVDQHVWAQWGIGARSADLARRTLAEVEAKSR
jgi:hypothetical protein